MRWMPFSRPSAALPPRRGPCARGRRSRPHRQRTSAWADLDRIAPGVYAVTSQWTNVGTMETSPGRLRGRRSAPPGRHREPRERGGTARSADAADDRPPRATMTVLDDRRTSEDDGWRRFHRGHTPPAHVVIDGGQPYLVPPTVVDCMREMRPGDALAVLDAALGPGSSRGPSSWRCADTSDAGPASPPPIALLRLGDGRRESWFESSSAWVMASVGAAARHPAGGRQQRRSDASSAASTCCWHELGVVGEADGRGEVPDRHQTGAWHVGRRGGPSRAMRARRSAKSRLRGLGLEVVRWDPPRPGPAARAARAGSTRQSLGPAPSRHGPIHLLLLPAPPDSIADHPPGSPVCRAA